MHILLPPITTLPLPDARDAVGKGCSCPGARGLLASVTVPKDPPDQRPLFGYDTELRYFYSLKCPLHGRAANELISELEPAI